MTSVSENSR